MDEPEPTGGSTEGESTEIATSTLAEIYEKQGLYDRAIAIWRKLARRAPGDEEIAERIEDLGRRLEATRAEGEAEEIPIPTDEGPAPVVAAGESHSLETEAARTGPPEDGEPGPAPLQDEAPPPDEDERFRAWLAEK